MTPQENLIFSVVDVSLYDTTHKNNCIKDHFNAVLNSYSRNQWHCIK